MIDEACGTSRNASYGSQGHEGPGGLAHVRKRPGMYIGGDRPRRPPPPGLGGRRQPRRRGDGRHCTRIIKITLHARRLVPRSIDDGRGHPVDPTIQPRVQDVGVEIALTKLRRRRQVRAARATRSPAASTASACRVVNALSRGCVVEVDRDGQAPPQESRQRVASVTRASSRCVGDAPPADAHRHHGHVLAGSDDVRRRGHRVPSPARCSSGCRRWPSLNKGLEIRLPRPAVADENEQVTVPLHGRPGRLREAPQRLEGGCCSRRSC